MKTLGRQFENRSTPAGIVHRWGLSTRPEIRVGKPPKPVGTVDGKWISFLAGLRGRGTRLKKAWAGGSHLIELEKLSAYQILSPLLTVGLISLP